jgi:hypothetical protein
MRNLTLPNNIDAIIELTTALTYQNGSPKHLLNSKELNDIKAIYKTYEHSSGVASKSLKALHFSSKTLEAIHDAYDEVQSTKRLKSLRSRLLLNVNRCPCCGISIADELDHHLPRSVYKVLSVYSSNLIPLCHKCNNKKRAITGDNEEKRFLHVYYGEVPENIQFLFAITSISNNTLNVNFEVREVDGISNLLFKRLTFQLQKVDFHERVKLEVFDFLVPYKVSFQWAYEALGAEGVSILLYKSAKELEKTLGLNNWKTSLLIALSKFEEFCDRGFEKVFI